MVLRLQNHGSVGLHIQHLGGDPRGQAIGPVHLAIALELANAVDVDICRALRLRETFDRKLLEIQLNELIELGREVGFLLGVLVGLRGDFAFFADDNRHQVMLFENVRLGRFDREEAHVRQFRLRGSARAAKLALISDPPVCCIIALTRACVSLFKFFGTSSLCPSAAVSNPPSCGPASRIPLPAKQRATAADNHFSRFMRSPQHRNYLAAAVAWRVHRANRRFLWPGQHNLEHLIRHFTLHPDRLAVRSLFHRLGNGLDADGPRIERDADVLPRAGQRHRFDVLGRRHRAGLNVAGGLLANHLFAGQKWIAGEASTSNRRVLTSSARITSPRVNGFSNVTWFCQARALAEMLTFLEPESVTTNTCQETSPRLLLYEPSILNLNCGSARFSSFSSAGLKFTCN